MKTPNNKSWIDEFDLKFSTLVEFHPDGSTTRKGVPRGMIEFISQLLQQERKAEHDKIIADIQSGKIKIPSLTIQQEIEVPIDVADHIRKAERERVIDECIKAANGTICRCMCPENQGRYEVITKLNQLKEEL